MAEPNFENRTLYHGDNLDFLRGMNSETVHLIATDPPFNKNRDFHATPDSLARGARFSDRWSWARDVHEDWVDSINDDWPAVWSVIESTRASYGDDMAAFLCWLGVRLMEMHRILRPDGSVYLHCDPTASHYIKALMDAIFGKSNFRNEIVWKRTATVKGNFGQNSKFFGPSTDTLLYYSKSDEYVFSQPFGPYSQEYLEKAYRHIEPETGRRYRLVSMIGPGGGAKGNPQYEVMGVTRYWRYSKERMQDLINAGLVVQTKPGTVPNRKYYLDEGRGVAVQSLWDDIPNLQAASRERTGFPTQKPLALYERIILASSNIGDIVLDPFCGCATTPIAAERMERQWVGIDIWDGAYEIVRQRIEDNLQLMQDIPKIHYSDTPPDRKDDNEVAAPSFRLKIQRAVEMWQRIPHRGMFNILSQAQASADGVICAGCGRVLEREFMELDHITPKSDRGENHILNRILLCRPCNGRKGDSLTLRGLMRENNRVDWTKAQDLARIAQDKARDRAEWVRDNFETEECQMLINA